MELKRNLLTLAVASILMSGGAYAAPAIEADAPAVQPATAPDDSQSKKASEDSNTLGEIKVTGVRAAIEKAVSIKQNSNEIVEAISAEDIGKLPDNSIADSLARLPGLAVQRVNGTGSLVSVRGLSGDFTGTLFNGREQVSTGDNRAVDFSQYAAELVSGVIVYKTQEATLVGQGLAGTIDLQTARPLDYDKRQFVVNARGETNSNGSVNANTDSKGYRVAASYIDQYLDHTLGLAVNYTRQASPVQDTRWESWGYTTTAATGTAQVLGGNKVYADSIDGTRDGLMTTIEWRPSDQFTSTLDAYYSKYNENTTYQGFEVGYAYGGRNPILTNPVVQGGVLTSGTWENMQPVLRNEYDEHHDNILSLGWNNKFHFGDHWTATADLAYSRANSNQSFLETYAGTVTGSPGYLDTIGFGLNPGTGLPHLSPGLNYADPNIIKLTDPGGWGQDGYYKTPKVTDKLKTARFDLARDIDSPISKIDAGVYYSDRTKTRNSAEFFVNLASGYKNAAGAVASQDIPSSCMVPSAFLGYVGFPNTVSWDSSCLVNSGVEKIVPNANGDIIAKDWLVNEKVTTGYIQANIDTEVAGLPLRGNIGGEYIHTEQNSNAYASGAQTQKPDGSNVIVAQPLSGGATYNNFLPDLNLILNLTDEQILRFGAGKEMQRARMDQMRASIEPSISIPPPGGVPDSLTYNCTNTAAGTVSKCLWTASAGNPELKPYLARAYDLSYEKYFGTKAYVSAAYFYKHLDTYIYNVALPYDFSNIPNPSSIDPATGKSSVLPASNQGLITQPVNGSGGLIHGYELSATLPLDVLWEPLDGFGVVANYSVTNSSIQPNGPATSGPLPGLSKYVSNFTAFYEQAGFSTRVAVSHRSDFLGEVQAFGADLAFRDIRAFTDTSVQIGYTLQNGRWEGLNFLLQVQNVFNKPYQEYYGVRTQPQQYTLYGRQVLLGLNYKF